MTASTRSRSSAGSSPGRMSGVTYPYDAPASQALFDRGSAVIPGGVNSPVRAFKAVGGSPHFIARARGGCARR